MSSRICFVYTKQMMLYCENCRGLVVSGLHCIRTWQSLCKPCSRTLNKNMTQSNSGKRLHVQGYDHSNTVLVVLYLFTADSPSGTQTLPFSPDSGALSVPVWTAGMLQGPSPMHPRQCSHSQQARVSPSVSIPHLKRQPFSKLSV